MGFDKWSGNRPPGVADVTESATRYAERTGVTYEAALEALLAELSEDDLGRLIAEAESQGGSK
jgi:hypothetical protein